MYAVAQCTMCRRPRVINLDNKVSTCPFCSNTDDNKNLRYLCRCRTEKNARDNLVKYTTGSVSLTTGFDGEYVSSKPKHAKGSTDPWSTLEHNYEKAKGLEAKIDVIVNSLAKVCGGDFTEEDLDRLDPKQGKKILKVMLDRCQVHEVKYGHYKP